MNDAVMNQKERERYKGSMRTRGSPRRRSGDRRRQRRSGCAGNLHGGGGRVWGRRRRFAGTSPSRLDSLFREVEEVAAELIAASDRAREVGADDERDGGDGRRSGRPRRSPTSSHSGTDATHRNVEENEMELLDMVDRKSVV